MSTSRRKTYLLHAVRILVGIAIGFLFALTSRSSGNAIVYGFPIPWGGWENVDGRWLDFIGPLSPVIWLIDVFVGIGLVYLAVIIVRFVTKKWQRES